MTGDVLEALGGALPADAVITDPDVVERFRHDRALTITPGTPLAVVRPTCTAQVQAALEVASRYRVPVVTRGAGSGLAGGASAIDGCITLSTERMRAMTVDAAAMVAVVEPGVLNAELKAAAREAGLWYPPDPSSFEICSIGGNLATNAGGLCCVKYGVTTDYVLGLEVVLADGRVVGLGGSTVKDVAGYDLKRLFVGSEGTLGVITGATLRLRPPPPSATTIAATFAHVTDAGRAASAIASAIRPSALELMDAAALAAVERVKPLGFGPSVGALLIARTDGGATEPEVVVHACEEARATDLVVGDDEVEAELLMAARRMAIPCVERLGSVLIEDVCVPIPRISELMAQVDDVASRNGVLVPVIGHAGDGNFHPLVTFDASDPDECTRAAVTFDEIMEVALRLGGTVSGEHGIGSLKSQRLRSQLGPDVMDITARIKAALDPYAILNPGKWV